MQIETTRFGALEINDDRVITFAEGLPGFEGCRRFTLVPHPSAKEGLPFEWLQSVEDGALAFLVMDPFPTFPDYAPEVSRGDIRSIAPEENADSLRVLTLLSIPKGNPCGITANLLAPVIVNPGNRSAKQVVLSGDRYGLRHRLIPEDAL